MSYLTLHASDVAVLYNKFVCNQKMSDLFVIYFVTDDETLINKNVVILCDLPERQNAAVRHHASPCSI